MSSSELVTATPGTVRPSSVCQVSGVKVNAPATVPSVVSPLVGVTITRDNGSVSSRTLNVAVPPASVVVRPSASDTVTPGTSSSTMATWTLG